MHLGLILQNFEPEFSEELAALERATIVADGAEQCHGTYVTAVSFAHEVI